MSVMPVHKTEVEDGPESKASLHYVTLWQYVTLSQKTQKQTRSMHVRCQSRNKY